MKRRSIVETPGRHVRHQRAVRQPGERLRNRTRSSTPTKPEPRKTGVVSGRGVWQRSFVTAPRIQQALSDIAAETDPTLKHFKLASLVSAVFRARGIELVVVGGAAIEFYTEGAYVSGDLDVCVESSPGALTAFERQQIMAPLQAVGGPRSWQVAGLYVDLLSSFECLARTPVRRIDGPSGPVRLAPVEELLVERVLVSKYPAPFPPARQCARKLLAAALLAEVETDWAEVRRLAEHPAYRNWRDVKALVHEQAQALQVRDPYDPHE